MKNIIAAIAFLIIGTSALAQNNITKAKISFELKNLGIKTGGVIGGVQGNITFDPAKLATSKIEATADVNAINTDNDMRDEHLKRDDYFDVQKYPKMSLSSVSFKKNSGNNFTGVFNLTVKGITKPIEVPFAYATVATGNLFKGSFKINRKDFKIGGNSMTMSDDVTINFEAEAAK
ncbi:MULTISPECIES: YceI family protein [unclassified Mucilaginibacter]|uniref:YceI family protein n=1 Tax=unclassified Mucilaginibacter TaxID=2617802 RepID=UPI002AC92924|nr:MULTISPECIES: YceI family protein [unclassified Mucilaginibacter]MEB0260445.1 YceI family protein [Mucilaginibacter sp. 10I4]MEB0280026.1 YceI family protein [Mucilaginibacter sp. 10B2]MEB0301336.1 YceI family protein [Mucilaginibacter sp. 5C4]WPX23632.1 YceI family protein [Mucilaginibacter sp. 5C4]